VTERTWQVEREDPAAAHQRASEVRREADAVSERVQRRMEAQERLVAAEQERAWQMQRDQQMTQRYDDYLYPGYVGTGPFPRRGFLHNRPPPFFELGSPPSRPMHRPSRPVRVSAPAMP
jgi:hypothetical protein